MKIGISKRDKIVYDNIADEMLANDLPIKDTPDGFKCVLHESDAYLERASTVGKIFYSFEWKGAVFHLSFD